MKTAIVLYSGGKDSSLVATMLRDWGFEVRLVTANFGVEPKIVTTAKEAANILGFPHEVFSLDRRPVDEAAQMCIEDGRPQRGINHMHSVVVEEAAKKYKADLIADGARRDDRCPKLAYPQIQHIEAVYKIAFDSPLMGFSYKTIKYLTDKLFKVEEIVSGQKPTSEYEMELRKVLKGLNRDNIFPLKHTHTILKGLK